MSNKGMSLDDFVSQLEEYPDDSYVRFQGDSAVITDVSGEEIGSINFGGDGQCAER